MDYKTIEDETYDFIDEYFDEELTLIEGELDFIDKNRLLTPCIDHTNMYNFLSDTMSKFKNIDSGFAPNTIEKLDSDIKDLLNAYKTFVKKISGTKFVFTSSFIKNSPTLRNYSKSILDLQTAQEKTEEEFVLLKHRKQNILKIKEIYYPIFNDIFLENVKIIRSDFKTCINTKMFYFDRLLWQAAKESKPITRHMKVRKMEGEFSSKEYLKFIMSLMRPYTDEYKYLEKCLKVYR